MKSISLIGTGNRKWIAGVQYLHSLLYGNSLLPADQQACFQLCLHTDVHHSRDYQTVLPYLKGIHYFDYFPGRPFPLIRKGYQMLHQLKRGEWPRYPANNFTQLLDQQRIDLIFPANEVVQNNVSCKQISWIPDFQHIHLPEYFTPYQLYSRNRDFERIMRRSDRIIVSNEYSYTDAVRLYPAYAHKVVILNFTMFLGENWREPDVGFYVNKYRLPKKYLLFPSQFWKHKNHLMLLEALHLVREAGLTDLTLVCTGHPYDLRYPRYPAEIQSLLSRKNLTPAVRILGLLPRHDQVQLMRGAAAIVQPSLFEGWSALLEDCRSLGKTVLASNIPMHQEQRTDRTFFFNPRSPRSIADCLLLHWGSLQPGPDQNAEADGERMYHERIGQFALRFNQICQSIH